ncbi:MAG TPA: alpha-galactosidase [Bryobacteraceae bacterium]|jgi:alpha-galactosidase|nr:alpha-galactosidase [Bryobacteraceae bacterium]
MPAQSWSIGNDQISRRVVFDARGLHTDSLQLRATGTEYVRGRAEEFSFQAGTRQFSGNSGWLVQSARRSENSGAQILAIELKDKQNAFGVTVHYAVYAGEPAIRQWLTITNTAGRLQTLTHLAFTRLNASPCEPHDCVLTGGYGTIPRELFMTGRVSDAAIFLRSVRTGEGMAVINEAPGYLKRTEMGEGWGTGLSVMYDTDLFPFARSLAPGETFESARSSIVFFKDGAGLLDPHWAIPGYMSRIVMRRGPDFKPAWLYNTWEPFERRINESLVNELTPIAARMKFDVFTIDDGWQPRYGENEINRTSFPSGVDAVAAKLKAQGVRLGLWVPLAAIGVDTADYKAHPEWACLDARQRPKITMTASGPSGLMCLASGYREFALKRISDLIAKYQLAYVKVDLTTVFNAYGEEPGCHAEGHFHRSWAESLDRIYEGLEYIGRKLHEEHPDVLVDYTFELWGEKHLIDAALLGVADLDWLSNVEDRDPKSAGPRQARMLLYQRAASIPVETMLIGNLHADTAPFEERLAVAFGSGPVLLGDLRKLSAEQQQWWGEQVAWYRTLRARASLLDSFFPLGAWQQPGSGAWDGFVRLSRESDGMVAIFRNTATEAEVKLVAPGSATYRARSVFENKDLGTVTSAQLSSGWQIPLDAHRSVTIIELHRVQQRSQ